MRCKACEAVRDAPWPKRLTFVRFDKDKDKDKASKKEEEQAPGTAAADESKDSEFATQGARTQRTEEGASLRAAERASAYAARLRTRHEPASCGDSCQLPEPRSWTAAARAALVGASMLRSLQRESDSRCSLWCWAVFSLSLSTPRVRKREIQLLERGSPLGNGAPFCVKVKLSWTPGPLSNFLFETSQTRAL